MQSKNGLNNTRSKPVICVNSDFLSEEITDSYINEKNTNFAPGSSISMVSSHIRIINKVLDLNKK